MRRNGLPVLVLIAAALLPAAGCSNFQQEWRQLAAAEAVDDPLAGRWKGSWKSDKSGHAGGLRCVAKRIDDDTYHLRFNASYMLLLRFGYDMNVIADPAHGITYVTGEADLGKAAGGVYEYEGHADGKTFHLNYRAGSDYGHFKLTRPR